MPTHLSSYGIDTPRDRLARLLAPESIAIIGASSDSSKRGYQAIRALNQASFAGTIYPVNPRGGDLLGLTVLKRIDDLPDGIDAALIALPGSAVPDVLRNLAHKDVGGAVVLANGFLEAGATGADLDADLKTAIAETGVRVIGPNTSGMLNVELGANLVGLSGVEKGPISVVTQSGNMWLSLVADNAATKGPGFQYYIGLGNQADVRYDECITFLADDPSTGAIAIHAEGIQDGREFLVAAAAAAVKRPIVMLRGGRSAIGQRTALSHTGSVAGSDAVTTAVMGQVGVELVDRSDELAVVAGALATTQPIPYGQRVAILSDGGGHATLAADALSVTGVELAKLSESTRTRLRTLLGPAAEVLNPIDVAGATDGDPTLFADCVEALMADEGVGMVLIVGLFGGYHLRFDANLEASEDLTAERILDLQSRNAIPILVQSCYASSAVHNHELLRSGGVQVLASIDHAARAVTALSNRSNWLGSTGARKSLQLDQDVTAPSTLTTAALDEPAARRLVESAGLHTGEWVLAESSDEVFAAVTKFDVPCAIKVVSPEVLHKSDAGGVRLSIEPKDAKEAWDDIIDSIHAANPNASISGMIVTPMAQKGVELLIGATRDPIFGPVVAFGSGGTMVEIRRDVTFRAAPFTHSEAATMINETIVARMLDGYRDLPIIDRSKLATLLTQVGNLIAADARIAELDLNPVIANVSGILPVDVRVVLTEPK